MADESEQGSRSVEAAPTRTHATREDDPDDGLLAECRLMLKFLRETGIAVPADLAHDIGALDELLREKGFGSLSELSPRLVEA
jgi:hypothetical protein